jgi:hypothetical protein
VSSWGIWGSASEHQRYAQAAKRRAGPRRRCSWCSNVGGSGKCTHLGMANGLCLCSGCEFHIAMWVRGGYAAMPARALR